jgi:hypothetical protein
MFLVLEAVPESIVGLTHVRRPYREDSKPLPRLATLTDRTAVRQVSSLNCNDSSNQMVVACSDPRIVGDRRLEADEASCKKMARRLLVLVLRVYAHPCLAGGGLG